MTEQPPPKRPQRPRDEMGRPLPWGAEDRLPLEDFDARSQGENHSLGIGHFNAGRFFAAHEAWETAWKQARAGADDRDVEFFKGLSQLGAGYTHYQRENSHGAQALMRRALGRIAAYAPRHRGIDVEALARSTVAQVARLEAAERAGEALPVITPPRI